jgi:uncharacterized protein (DUF1501 family)
MNKKVSRTNLQPQNSNLSRRDWLRLSAVGSAALAPWFSALADETARDPRRRRACILLWMGGGPSQIDTFDPKPGHANGGPVEAIETAVPGIQIGQHFPRLARLMEHAVLVRSMSTKEGDHVRATYYLRTGRAPQGPIHYPTLGSFLSKELQTEAPDLPSFVSIGPFRNFNPAAFGPGFLGPSYAPLVVGDTGRGQLAGQENFEQSFRVRNLEAPADVTAAQAASRLELLEQMEDDFAAWRPGIVTESRRAAYHGAVRMMHSQAGAAFKLDDEPGALRDAYGRNQFGQGCLLARRLVERGVPFVEVSLNGIADQNILGWDTHRGNFPAVQRLCEVLDPAWATLLTDLRQRGLLESTLVVWMGEFGRTPVINGNQGRDHFPGAWSTVLCGGGIRGGQVIGRTSPDGMTVEERPVSVPDLLATVCRALGVDPRKQNLSNVGRPIRLVEPDARPIEEALS